MHPALPHAQIRVLIAHEQHFVREGARRILSEAGLVVVGEAVRHGEVAEVASQTHAEVIVMSAGMLCADNSLALRAPGESKVGFRVIVLAASSQPTLAVRLLHRGAAGYVTHDSPPSELVEAVRVTVRGGRYICASLCNRIPTDLGNRPAHGTLESLSDRELAVLRGLASGATNRELATELSLSVKTVDVHRMHVLRKLGLRNNADLARFAVEHGILEH